MFTYETGLVVALLIGILKIGLGISAKTSQRAKNFARIGLHYDAMAGAFGLQKKTGLSFVWFLVWMLVLAPLFSWLSVASALFGFIRAKVSAPPVPDKVKEIQFKIASCDLSRDQMIELQVELSRVLGMPPYVPGILDDGESNPDALILEERPYFREITLERGKKVIHMYGHPPDGDGIYRSEHEYRIDGNRVIARTTMRSAQYGGTVEYAIKDGVVTESEIRSRAEAHKISWISPDKEIERAKAEAEWAEVLNAKMRYFILSRHPECVPPAEYRRFLRSELERVISGTEALIRKLRDVGAAVREDNEKVEIEFREISDEKEKLKHREDVQALLSTDGLTKFNLVGNEFFERPRVLREISFWLGDKEKSRVG